MDRPALAISRSLFAFSIFYGGMVCIAGVLGNKQVTLGPVSELGQVVGLGPLAIEAGVFGRAVLGQLVVKSLLAVLLLPPLVYGFVALGRWLDARVDPGLVGDAAVKPSKPTLTS